MPGPALYRPALGRRRCLLGLAGLALYPWLPAFANPSPLVTLDWSIAQTLLALGAPLAAMAEIDRYRHLVRVPALPASVLELGLRQEPNLELLAQLAPGQIFINSYQNALRERLQAIAPVQAFSFASPQGHPLEQAALTTRQIAQAVGRDAKAQVCIDQLEAQLQQSRQALQGLHDRPLYVISLVDNRRAMVFGHRSLFQDVLDRLGLRNAWSGETNTWGYATIGLERLADTPQASLVYFNSAPGLQDSLPDNPIWNRLDFVRQRRLVQLPEVLFFGALPAAGEFARLLTERLPETQHA
ncbi:ABC transporter substrate-binding protein [Pseudomonas sp. TE3610]